MEGHEIKGKEQYLQINVQHREYSQQYHNYEWGQVCT